MQTYGDLACTKRGVNKNDHVQAYTGDEVPPQLPGENLTNVPVKIDLDPGTTEIIRPTSRINVSKLYTVQHNLRFCSVGQVRDEDFDRLEVLIYWAIAPGRSRGQ
jgi:hypothetical protein